MWYRLRANGVKDNVVLKLMNEFKNYEDIFLLSKEELKEKLKNDFNFENDIIENIYESKGKDFTEHFEKLKKLGIKILSLKDKEYPKALKEISSPPVFLYYKGDLSLTNREKLISVVGTRRATSYGKNACEKIVDDLVEADVVIVSGLATGIDSISHRRTLQKKGKTIAVVGSALDVIYPIENKDIWQEIEEKGLIISEYPLGTQPMPYNFPRRNRIIAGLARGVLVVESKEKGGSLITALLAFDEGRDIFAVPGDIFSPVSVGTNNLIKSLQAKLVSSGKDILEEYNWNDVEEEKKDKNKLKDINMTEEELKIYETLEVEKNLDEIISKTNIRAGNLLAILMEMEIKGIVSSIAGGKYRRKK